jgi:ketosteroid isomerase-like protein
MTKTIAKSASAVTMLALLVGPCALWASDAKTAKQLIQFEQDWSAATVVHDPAVVERLLADDYVGVDGRGIFSNKADEIKEASAPDANAPPQQFTVTTEALTDFRVRVYGDTAIVNARTVQQQIDKSGTEREVQFRRTTVWLKRQSRWQCVSFHGSRILLPVSTAVQK